MQRIAIVGIGGLFPGADSSPDDPSGQNLDKFWKNIQSGRDCSREVPADRWLLEKADAWSEQLAPDKVNSIRGCFLDSFQLNYRMYVPITLRNQSAGSNACNSRGQCSLLYDHLYFPCPTATPC